MTTLLRDTLTHVSRRWFLIVLLLLFVALSVQYTFKAMESRSAILRWRPQIQSMEDGVDINHRFNYPNPPIMAILLWPVVSLPPIAGALTWFYLKVGMTLLALLWVFRMVETPEQPFPPWAKALTVLLAIRPIMSDLTHGNVNIFILFVVVAGLYAYCQRRDLLAGGLIALAIACKLTPALLVPYLVWKRAWKALAGCAIGLVLFFLVVPGSILGWQQNARQLQSWVSAMVLPYARDGVVTSEHNNQSLPGLAQRMLTHSPSFSDYIDNRYTPLEYHNLATLDPQVVRWLVKGCMAGFVLLVMWICQAPTSERSGWRLAAEFAVVLIGMLLFSERTWKHHCVTLLVPFAVICYYLVMCRPSRVFGGILAGTLVAAMLLMASTSTGMLDDRLAKLAQVYGAWVWMCLLLLGALSAMLRREWGMESSVHEPIAPPGQRQAA